MGNSFVCCKNKVNSEEKRNVESSLKHPSPEKGDRLSDSPEGYDSVTSEEDDDRFTATIDDNDDDDEFICMQNEEVQESSLEGSISRGQYKLENISKPFKVGNDHKDSQDGEFRKSAKHRESPNISSNIEDSTKTRTGKILAKLKHEIESSLKEGQITDGLKTLLNSNQEFMSFPSEERRSIREKLEGIVTNHLRENVSSEQFSVTLASNDNGLHFVVLCADDTFQTRANLSWMTYVTINHNNMESTDAIPQRLNKPLSVSDKNKLEEFINTELYSSCVKMLFKEHSNLNSVSFTMGKSINYGSRNWIITDEICVVLQCFHKGYIPFGESPLPSKIGNYRTDIREGYCCFSTVHVGRSVYTESNQMASIGNIVQLDDGSTAFITCAHAIFPMQKLSQICDQDHNFRGTEFFDRETGKKIGQVKEFQFKYNSVESVDAALVSLTDDNEIVFGLPIINMDMMPKPELHFQPFHISSAVIEERDLPIKCCVVKYGATTNFTVGTLELGDSSVKPFHWDIKENLPSTSQDNEPLIMLNQILINPLEEGKPFLRQGDSGSFVFMVDDQEKALKCIGMLIGQTSSGQGIMTPIRRILDKLNLQGMHTFPGPVKLQTTFSNPMMEMMGRLQLSMNSLHEKVRNIDDVVHRLEDRIRPLEDDYRQRHTKEMETE